MTSAIVVENLSKKYLIGHQTKKNYSTFREELASGVRNFGLDLVSLLSGKKPGAGQSNIEEFWALKDLNINIEQGDRIGIIGRNGAGKSTLLKVLSRITEPTTGKVTINGRVASLLEVGTGFHPELSGRENIFLNGAILGMSRVEIKNKFDEIVEFAGVERFLDTPVKRYSSGMYTRLAFAVAAHLEPEILIVDEVLAVGDASFQKKCLGKMEEVGKQGRTVLFVSHNMAAIQSLCDSCIYLENGKINSIGPTRETIDKYLAGDRSLSGQIDLRDRKDRKGSGKIVFQEVRFLNENGDDVSSFRCGEAANFAIDVISQSSTVENHVIVGIGIDSSSGERITIISNELSGQSLLVKPGSSTILVTLSSLALLPGTYYFTLFMSAHGEITDWMQTAGVLTVDEADFYGTGKLAKGQGYFLMEYEYSNL